MKLAWMFCFLLVGKLSTASPVDESTAAAESGVGSSYMMAFPMDDDQVAEESVAQEAVKMLADSLASEDEKEDASEDKKEEEDATEQPEPMRILQAELDAEEEAEKPALPQRPFFKRPKIEELRKILGFPAPEGPAAKSKPIPQEKPKVFTGLFNKPKPKLEVTTQQSPLGGIQFNLRREDRMRVPFGLPMLSPLKRDSPFGIPDLVQAASSLLRRAIVDDNSENDITSKDDKDEDDEENNQNDADDNEEEEDEDSLMIVPIPDSKEVAPNAERPPLFRRFPIPFPFSKPAAQAQNNRPRLPFPPLTPVAFFLPIAQQIMQNIRHAQPRSQPPPMMHIPHPAQNFIPIHTQMPIIPIHHPQPQPQQHFIHIQPQQQHFIPMQPQQQQHFIPMQPQQQQHFIPMQPQQQQHFIPQQFIPQPQQLIPFIQQASMHVPVLTHILPNLPQQQQQRPMMQRRMPVHHPAPQQIPRRPMMPMARSLAPQLQQQQPIFIHRPIQQQQQRPTMPQRPPMPPVHPVLFMMPMPAQPVPVFHKPPQQQQHFMAPPRHFPEEERVIFVRNDQPEDDDQEVLILVPSDEVEVQQRPPVLMPPQQQLMRHVPTPVVNPLQRIRLLRDLLMARRHQQQQQAMMSPQNRAARVVEIVQQQLRIFPAHHPHHQPPMVQRADPSELHPVYVPYPGPQ